MINNDLPFVTIIIATFNSHKVLPRTLEALRNQTYPQERMEIFVVDGGSTDDTREIAEKYDCLVLDNPKTEPGYARFVGLKNAKGKYVVTVDHDEVLINPNSILDRVNALIEHPECKVAHTSGYKKPTNYPLLNQYISDFGDPYSLYLYHCPKDYKFFTKFVMRNYKIVADNDKYIQVEFDKMPSNLLLELFCGAVMVDWEYFKTFMVMDYEKDVYSLTHAFYVMILRGEKSIIINKNDPLEHYSVDSLKAYLPKLKWRIINNVHFPEKAANGTIGREDFQETNPIKKYFFIPYIYTFIFPFCEGLVLAMKRKNIIYLLHPFLGFYVATEILWQYFRKIIKNPPAFTSYDGKKKLER